MSVHIRFATSSDIKFLVEIERDCFSSQEENLLESFSDFLKKNPTQILCALENEKVCAFCCIVFEDDFCVLADIAVSKTSQRKKIGTMLLSKAIYLASEKKCKSLQLTVRSSNVSALFFYEKNNFMKSQILFNYYGDEDGIRMIKWLDK